MNCVIREFNTIIENALTKICNLERDDWDHKIHAVLWAYCTTYKRLTGKTPFRLFYGQEYFMSMEYMVPYLRIVVITKMIDVGVVKERLLELVQLEEDIFVIGYNQNVEKA